MPIGNFVQDKLAYCIQGAFHFFLQVTVLCKSDIRLRFLTLSSFEVQFDSVQVPKWILKVLKAKHNQWELKLKTGKYRQVLKN